MTKNTPKKKQQQKTDNKKSESVEIQNTFLLC